MFAASKGDRHRLQKLLNSSIRFIYNLTGDQYRNHITPYLKELHILPVEERLQYKVALYVYKCINSLAPTYLSDLMHQKVPSYELRCIEDLFLLESDFKPKTRFGRASFSYNAPLIWNNLPAELKLCSNITGFKKGLKAHFFRMCFE